MAKAREIKKRIKAVGNIKRITKTMQMIATSKFAKAQQRALASKPYVEGIFELVTDLAAKAGNIEHPLIKGPARFKPDAKEIFLVVTSDRGLCGPYNSSILRAALKILREQGDKLTVQAIGRKGITSLTFNKIPIDARHALGDTPKFEDVERLANRYMNAFISGEIKGVRIVSMKFISTARQKLEVLQLLPLKPPAVEGAAKEEKPKTQVNYEFSPEPEQLLADLLPATVKATLYQVFNDAIVSEHVARMVAMKSATDARMARAERGVHTRRGWWRSLVVAT